MNCEWPQQMQICLDKLPLKDQWGEVVSQDGAVRGQGQHMRAFSFSEPILRGALPTGVYEAGVPCAADQSSRGNVWVGQPARLTKSFVHALGILPDAATQKRSVAVQHERFGCWDVWQICRLSCKRSLCVLSVMRIGVSPGF